MIGGLTVQYTKNYNYYRINTYSNFKYHLINKFNIGYTENKKKFIIWNPKRHKYKIYIFFFLIELCSQST